MRYLLIAILTLTFTLPSMTALASLSQTEVSQLYIGVFGRASEGGGNSYWQTDPRSTNMTATANEMLDSEPALVYFGSTLGDNQLFIEHIYSNTLGKTYAEDTTGVDYWVSELNGGKTKGEVIAALIGAAQDPVNQGAAQDLFNNKVTVSNYCADTIIDYTNLETFTGFLSSVTDDPLSVTLAKELVDVDASGLGQQTSFKFTTDWLNGKTLYNVFEDDGNLELATFTFTVTSYSAFMNNDPANMVDNVTYTVTAEGYLILADPDDTNDTSAIKVIEETADYLTIRWEDSIENLSKDDTDGVEYFYFYLQDAEDFINTKNAEIAANSEIVTMSGKVSFLDSNGTSIAIPTDAGIRIISDVDQYNHSWGNGFEMPITADGTFSLTKSQYQNSYTDGHTFQVVIFKNHIEPDEMRADCGEDIYRFVLDENFMDISFVALNDTLVVYPDDYQDRSSDECSD